MAIRNGKWWFSYTEDSFDCAVSQWFELKDGQVVDRDGNQGRYAVFGNELTLWDGRADLPMHFTVDSLRGYPDHGKQPITDEITCLSGDTPIGYCWLRLDGPWTAEETSISRSQGVQSSLFDEQWDRHIHN